MLLMSHLVSLSLMGKREVDLQPTARSRQEGPSGELPLSPRGRSLM